MFFFQNSWFYNMDFYYKNTCVKNYSHWSCLDLSEIGPRGWALLFSGTEFFQYTNFFSTKIWGIRDFFDFSLTLRGSNFFVCEPISIIFSSLNSWRCVLSIPAVFITRKIILMCLPVWSKSEIFEISHSLPYHWDFLAYYWHVIIIGTFVVSPQVS